MMKPTNLLSTDVRKRAGLLIIETQTRHLSCRQAVMSIAAKIGCTPCRFDPTA